jgi:hypothetical protein
MEIVIGLFTVGQSYQQTRRDKPNIPLAIRRQMGSIYLDFKII